MTKNDLADIISEKIGISHNKAVSSIDIMIEETINAVCNGDNVTLVGFGTFTTVTKKKHNGRDPITKEDIVIPEKVCPKFKSGKAFREAVSKMPHKL